MSIFSDVWNGCRKVNVHSALVFLGSSVGTAAVGLLFGNKAAAVAGLVGGVIASQHRPLLEIPDHAAVLDSLAAADKAKAAPPPPLPVEPIPELAILRANAAATDPGSAPPPSTTRVNAIMQGDPK